MISFDTTKDDMLLIREIAKRAAREMPADYQPDGGLLDADMDVTACHANGCPLDLVKLLAAPRFDFIHDVGGIRQHLDRETGELRDCFLPRCAMPE